MENHVRILGILNIIFGSLGLLGALFILLIFGGVAGVIGAVGGGVDTGELPPGAAAGIVGIIGVALFLFLLVVSLPGIIAGIGLLRFRHWGRILGIILAAISLPGVPVGTALGVYGLWVLLNNETVALFANPPRPAPRY